MLVHAALHVRLLDSDQLLSLLLAVPIFLLCCVQLHADTLLDHKYTGMFPQRLRSTFKNSSRSSNFARLRCTALAKVPPRGPAPSGDLDFCTLLTVLDCRMVKVCSFRNCLAHLQTRFASRIMCGMSGSLERNPLADSHFSVISLAAFSLSLVSHADQP